MFFGTWVIALQPQMGALNRGRYPDHMDDLN